MASRRTSLPDFETPQHQIQLVMDHEKIAPGVGFKLPNQRGNCQPAQVHIRLRLGQNHFAPGDEAGCGRGPAAPVLHHYALLLGDAVDGHEPRVVRGPQILRPRIAQPDNKEWAAGSGFEAPSERF